MLGQLGHQFDQDSLESYLGDSPPSSSHTSQEDLKDEDFEKSVLTDELQCVGLNPHLRSEWAMTVLKILSYPELITPDGDSRRYLGSAPCEQGK